MLRFDTVSQRWESGFNSLPFQGRAYHTAVLLGNKIWVMGGSNECTAFHDTWVLDTETLAWESVAIRCWCAGALPMQLML